MRACVYVCARVCVGVCVCVPLHLCQCQEPVQGLLKTTLLCKHLKLSHEHFRADWSGWLLQAISSKLEVAISHQAGLPANLHVSAASAQWAAIFNDLLQHESSLPDWQQVKAEGLAALLRCVPFLFSQPFYIVLTWRGKVIWISPHPSPVLLSFCSIMIHPRSVLKDTDMS